MALPLIAASTLRQFGWSSMMKTFLRNNPQEEAQAQARREVEMALYEARREAQRMLANNVRFHFDSREFTRVLNEYAVRVRKTSAEVLIKKGRDLSVKLYQEFARYTPTKERIRMESEASLRSKKGLRIRERARGSPRVVVYNGGRGKRKRTMNLWLSWVESEIRERQGHRFATSATWLFKRWRPSPNERGRKLMSNSQVQGGKGGTQSAIIYQLDGPKPFVELRNSTPGVVEQENRHQLIQKALSKVTADMLMFLASQNYRDAQYFNRRNAPTARFVGQRALYNLLNR